MGGAFIQGNFLMLLPPQLVQPVIDDFEVTQYLCRKDCNRAPNPCFDKTASI
jgi:hypothetical protein